MEVAKFYMNAIANCSNDPILAGFGQLIHTHAIDLKVVGNAKHICSFEGPMEFHFSHVLWVIS